MLGKENPHPVLDGVFRWILPLVFLGPSAALYVVGGAFVTVLSFATRTTPSISSESGFLVLWLIAAGIGLVSCIRLARCQRRERLATVGNSIWLGICVGYSALLVPAALRLLSGRGISPEALLKPVMFYMGGGPALYVPIIVAWMVWRERQVERRQAVVTL